MGDATWWKNAQLFNRTRVNAGFVVKNNTFTSIRRHGVIARATDGVITGNTITGASNSGITLINEPNFWANGLHSERVLIARNKITASTFDASSTAAAGIAVNLRSLYDHSANFRPKAGPVPKPERLHRGIRIENNTITDWNHRAIFLRSATDCSVTGNIIAAAPGAKFLAPDSCNTAILIDNTAGCLIAGNDTAGDPRLTAPAQHLAINDSEGARVGGNTWQKKNPNSQ
ncbi:MAG: right-handed parallel beta-helix repeat-containing protein [Opitutaceae bacterium]|nr:right-handed parallel beta-helix repeat-containing protein [Opitutaceae bacterium]